MLVLSRRPGEVVAIGESIRVVVLEKRRSGAVKLGVLAPPEVPISREDSLVLPPARAEIQQPEMQE